MNLLVMLDPRGVVCTIAVGGWIVERQEGSTRKRIRAIFDDHIVCESLAGRQTRVARRNLGRYWPLGGEVRW